VGNAVLVHTTDGGATWIAQNNIRAGDMNVVATIPGTVTPDEIYIICGHYDDTSQNAESYAPGADDNGTGTISTIEAARVLRGERFESTLRFVCFSREEQGLVGSGAYARKAAARGDSIIGALSFDMIGYVNAQPEDIDIIYDSPSAWMCLAYEEAAGLYVPGLGVRKRFDPGMASSDQKSFWNNGYCAFCGIEDDPPSNPYYHRTTDRVSTLDFSFYTSVVKGAVAMLADKARIDSVTASVPSTVDNLWFKVGPNPGLGEVSIQMAAGPGRARSVEIYDISGRLVKRITPSVDGGVAGAVWRGDDASGAKVAAGIYFVRAQGRRDAAKVVLVK
jgi:Zn-dependent M28 family amino/carboxypeptidase